MNFVCTVSFHAKSSNHVKVFAIVIEGVHQEISLDMTLDFLSSSPFVLRRKHGKFVRSFNSLGDFIGVLISAYPFNKWLLDLVYTTLLSE